jgi:hypothetical protein
VVRLLETQAYDIEDAGHGHGAVAVLLLGRPGHGEVAHAKDLSHPIFEIAMDQRLI